MRTIVYNGLESIQNDLRRFAYLLTQDKEKASDLVQETNLKALEKADIYVSDNSLKGWCYVIMKRHYLNECKKRQYQGLEITYTNEDFRLNRTNEDTNEYGEMIADLRKSLDALPMEYERTLKYYVDGFKYREISDIMKVPIGTVKSRIAKGKKFLKEIML